MQAMPLISDANSTSKKFHCGGKGCIVLNDGRRRRATRKKIVVPRAASGVAKNTVMDYPLIPCVIGV